MITVVTVWLWLITHVACDVVITVNNNGSDNDKCCVNGTCPCSSLSSALHNVSDNTVINITSESVTLHDIVGMGSGNLSNITITGNGATIMCNNTGGVYCESCSNVTIMGITWYQCGHSDSTALAFINSSSDILIQDCTFQNCPVYIQNAKRNISVTDSIFLNSVGIYISYYAKIVVAVSDSKFDGNGCTESYCSGVGIEPSNRVFEFNQFLFQSTNFSNYYDYGLDLSTSGENATVELYNVNVNNNNYGINIRGKSDLSGTVDILSATFVNNFNSLVVEFVDTVSVSSATFINNYGSRVYANNISISSATFNNRYGLIVFGHGSMILENSTFSNNKDTALHLFGYYNVLFKGNILFINNSANDGGAVYTYGVDSISFEDDSNVQFINNSANLRGGAMYIDLVNLNTDIHPYCNVFNGTSNASNVSFTNNSAGIAGNSIYFSIPKKCQIITNANNKSSLLYYPSMFEYLQPVSNNPPVVTSPYNIKLYPPAIAIQSHNSDNDYLIQESKMLGEPVQIVASVFDYFNNISEAVTFSINCKSCGNDYTLSTSQISVDTYKMTLLPAVASDVIKNTNISITFLLALTSVYRQLSASLSIELSSCRAGYLFNSTQRQCVCYPHSDLVHCKGDYTEIKIGYWIGYLTEQLYTSSICPNNYCNSEHKETNPGYYNLHGKSDDQCSSHRTGVACGECKSGYTLAYDSPDCINTDKCSAGMTILVITLTILYWFAIVAVVFGLMYFQFQISSGYAYGIIYFYSIVDILLVNNVSEDVSQFVNILSSFAKLTPQLFGQLCLVEGLSGTDQQFIHYFHALAVSLILLIIVLVTRYSPRLTQFVGRCIIRVICILLLLAYTSLASTSLQLLRPLTFNDDVDEVRTYSSPDIKYFAGRHLVYAIVAILCEVIIVIGLPLFFLLEPFLRRRVNLVRIKPLLDQFQRCYKDKYRWFAAYYLICRQVLILIVYVGNENYYYRLYSLHTACVIIAMIHGWVQPYKNNLLNRLDEVILLILVLVVNLNLFSLSSFIPTNYLLVVLVILPLLLICFITIRKLISHFFIRKKRELQLYNSDKENDRNNKRRLNVNETDINHYDLQDSLLDYADD